MEDQQLELLNQQIQQLKQQIQQLPNHHQTQQQDLQDQLRRIDPQQQQEQLQILQQQQQQGQRELERRLGQLQQEQHQLQLLQKQRLPNIVAPIKKDYKEGAMLGNIHNASNPDADKAAMDLIEEESKSDGPFQLNYYSTSSESESDSESRKKPTRKLPLTSLGILGNVKNTARKTLKRGANKVIAAANAGIIAAKNISHAVHQARQSEKYREARADLENADLHADVADVRARATFGQSAVDMSNLYRSLGTETIRNFLALNLKNSIKVRNFLDLDFNSKLYFIWVITTHGRIIKIPIFAYPVRSAIENTNKPFTWLIVVDYAIVPLVYHDGKFYVEATSAPSILKLKSIKDIGTIKEIAEHYATLNVPVEKYSRQFTEEYSIPNTDTSNRLTEHALNQILTHIAEEELINKGYGTDSVVTAKLYEYNAEVDTALGLSILANQKSASILDSDKPESSRDIPTLHDPTIRELLGAYTFGPNVKNREAYLGKIAPPLQGIPESEESKRGKRLFSASNRHRPSPEEIRDKRKAEDKVKRSAAVAEKRTETDQEKARREAREARIARFGNLGGARTYKKNKKSKRHRKTKKRKNHRSKKIKR